MSSPLGIFVSLLKRLQQDLTCTNVPWFPAGNAGAARLINDVVIGEETDVDPDGSYFSHLDLNLRAMEDVGAGTHQFDTFRSLTRAGASIGADMVQIEVPPHVRAFVAHTIDGSVGGVLLWPRGHHSGDVQQAAKDKDPPRCAERSVAPFCLLSNGTLSSMVTVTGQWGGSCWTDWLLARRRRTSVRCTQRAAASRLGSTFGMAR
jgi:hypothetical protein